MIKYSLKCAEGHQFDSWFANAEAYDKLAASNMVSCAVCGSNDVEKAIMAPRVSPNLTANLPVPAPCEGRPLSKPQNPAEQAIAELKEKVERDSEYVGKGFVSEARAIHSGDAPERAIYGEAKPEEARKLVEEGVPVAPLPFVPNRKSN